MNKKIKQNFTFKKGFSIAEVLIALFVLAFGTIAAIYLMSGSMQDTMKSRDLLIASMLSQEGTELVRNIRDNNVTEKDANTSIRGKAFEGFSDGNCIVDFDFDVNTRNNDGSFRRALKCPSSNFQLNLVYKNGVLFYTHNSGKPSKFKRKIIIKSKSQDVKDVISMVVWNDKNFPNDKKDCHIGQSCMYSETTLTAWLNFE